MDLRGSVYLKEIPDLSEATSLEKLDLSYCKSLLGITSSIGNATKLRVCKLKGCMLLKELPSSIGRLVNLEELDLSGCKRLLGITSSIGNATKLRVFKLASCLVLKELPSSIGRLVNLEELDLSDCKSLLELTSSIGNATKLRVCTLKCCMLLKELPSSIGRLVNLEELDLRYCSSLKEFSGCSSLKTLRLSDTAIKEVPSSMSTWSCLYKLDMCGCKNLKEFPNVPDSIVILMLSRTRIEEIPPWIEKLFRLRKLIMFGCEKLKTISPNISKLENLEFLELTTGVCVYNKENFTATIKWGPDLKHSWSLRSDFKVDYIFPICLPEKVLSSPRSLYFHSRGFKTIPDCIRSFSGLSVLVVKNCGMLQALPQLPGSLQSIDAESCKSLKRIDSSFQNPNICLHFSRCFNLNQ